jgi:branched-chain amino acid transport system substrate-binding protein
VTSASLTTGMESIGKIDLGGYPLNFSPRNHHGSAFVDITVLGPRGRYMR